MSLTPDAASTLRRAQLGLCRADVRPPSRSLPADIKNQISGILASWGMR
jgi:hypothetical protein